MGQSQTKIDYHNGTYYLYCLIEKHDKYKFMDDYYPLGETTIKITIEPNRMVFEPDEKFKEADLELTGLHSLTFYHKNDTTFHSATGPGEVFIQDEFLDRIYKVGIMVSDDKQIDGVVYDYLILDRSFVFVGKERAVVYMGNAIFIPKGTNRRISLE